MCWWTCKVIILTLTKEKQLELKIYRKFDGCNYDKQITMWMNKRESNYEMKQKTQEENQFRKLTSKKTTMKSMHL